MESYELIGNIGARVSVAGRTAFLPPRSVSAAGASSFAPPRRCRPGLPGLLATLTGTPLRRLMQREVEARAALPLLFPRQV